MAEEGATSHFDNASYIQKLEDVLTQVVNECVDEQPAQPFEFIADRLRNQDAGGADDSSGQRLPHPSGASLDLSAETLRADEWSLLSWCEAAGVHRVLFSALRRAVVAQNGGRYSSEAALAFVQGLQSREAVAAVLSSAPILDTLVDLMWEGAQKLRAAPAATGSQLNDKFSADGSGFTLKYGDLSTFFGGLEGKIGAPNPKSALVSARTVCCHPATTRQTTRQTTRVRSPLLSLGRSLRGDGARAHQSRRLARTVYDGKLWRQHDAADRVELRRSPRGDPGGRLAGGDGPPRLRPR